MHRLLLLSFFVVSAMPHSLFSQPYQSLFGNQYTSWNTYYEIYDGGFTDSISTGNDTVVDNKNYRIIYESGYQKGLLREDAVAGKAWFRNIEDSEEFLFMDLELQVNDSFLFNELYGNNDYKIVDSIYWKEGKKHIRFAFDGTFPLVYDTVYPYQRAIEFIEGLGSNIGISYQNNFYLSLALLCADKDGQKIFMAFPFCRFDWVGIEESYERYGIHIFPNPMSTEAFVNLRETAFPCKLSLYNFTGKKVKINTVSQFPFLFSRDKLPGGIYFMVIEDREGKISSEKIIINSKTSF